MSSIANNAGRTASVQALSSYFRDLDSIQEELEEALGGWETPVVLVFGAESAGKSTILERVAMLPLFPKGDGICTRLPILVQLRQSKDDRPAWTEATPFLPSAMLAMVVMRMYRLREGLPCRSVQW